MEQISALQQIHTNALDGLRVAAEKLVMQQEQVLREEKASILRELAVLRARLSQTHST